MTNLNQPKNKRVQEVFNKVFNKYDLMNDLMSLGIHRLWKKKLVDWINPSEKLNILDMSAGTGDVAKVFLKRENFRGHITCVDPNPNMIRIGKNKFKNMENIKWVCSSAEKLQLKSEAFDVYVVSFGLRNFENTNSALKEAFRVLKPGGRFICLEFSKVENELLQRIYKTYSKTIPYLGKFIIGNSEPYEYLINSIENFYSQEELTKIIKKNNFSEVEFRNLSGGIAAIHSGWKI